MFDKAHGCASDAVSIRRNAFLAIFTSIELVFLNFKILKFLTASVCAICYLSNESKIMLIC